MTTSPDIVAPLREAEKDPAQITPEGMRYILRQAADLIETLRLLVGIREETEAEAALDEIARTAGRA